jgi:hypothetical protein
MKVVIYETLFTSPFSIICSLVTASGYSHGAILNNGVLYDTTFSRGHFDIAPPVDDRRKVAVVEAHGDCETWIRANLYTEYDTPGLLLWFFRIATAGRMYCFNIVEKSLSSVGVHLNLKWRKSGGNILTALLQQGYKVEVMQGKQFNERYLR